MAKNDLCFACRTLIDEPWTEEPHAALKTLGTAANVRIVDFNTEYYECRVCGATLKRTEATRSGEVAWARVA